MRLSALAIGVALIFQSSSAWASSSYQTCKIGDVEFDSNGILVTHISCSGKDGSDYFSGVGIRTLEIKFADWETPGMSFVDRLIFRFITRSLGLSEREFREAAHRILNAYKSESELPILLHGEPKAHESGRSKIGFLKIGTFEGHEVVEIYGSPRVVP